MIRLSSSICAALAVFLLASSPSIQSAEIAKYDDGSFAGPYSESARVGDLLFLAGQIGEDKDGLVPGGIKAEVAREHLQDAG